MVYIYISTLETIGEEPRKFNFKEITEKDLNISYILEDTLALT